MKKLFIVLICVGMVAGIGIGGFMMLQTLGQEQGQEQTRQEQKQPKYSTRESVFADANPSLSEAEVKKRVAMNLDQEPYTSVAEVKDPDSITVLVNQYNTLPSDYVPEDLDAVVQDEQGVIALRKEAADAYRALEAEAKENQVDLRIMTAFIPYDSIQASYEELKKAHGEAAVDASFSRPGSSEYQTGLSADIQIGEGENAQQDIAQNEQYAWLLDRLPAHGFIVRYPEDKAVYTQMNGQPWHIRYVGKDTAQAMTKDGLCLEEYALR